MLEFLNFLVILEFVFLMSRFLQKIITGVATLCLLPLSTDVEFCEKFKIYENQNDIRSITELDFWPVIDLTSSNSAFEMTAPFVKKNNFE